MVRPTFTHFKERIRQLKEHHEIHTKEVLSALTDRGKDAYEIASSITWSITDGKGWASLPLLQRFFATGETLAHLQYLDGKGQVQKQMQGKRLIYTLSKKL